MKIIYKGDHFLPQFFADDADVRVYGPDIRIYYIPNEQSSFLNFFLDPTPPMTDDFGNVMGDQPNFEKLDPRQFLSLDELKAMYLYSFGKLTQAKVNELLPDWRMVRWRPYAEYTEKIQRGETLEPRELREYEAFLDPNVLDGGIISKENHETCYAYVSAALEWAVDVLYVNKECEVQVFMAQDHQTLIDIYPVYPDPPF